MDSERIILHADMDAFYAAIEQRDRPELAGRPVIVGGLGRRGVVSTASYEARAFGVHSALPTAQARRRCPHGVYLTPRMDAYIAVAQEIRDVFDGLTDLVEPLSLDEAFLDVSGSVRLFGDGETMARGLIDEVRRRTGLTVSVGVAACKFVAKVASDLDKPAGLVVVPTGGEQAFLAPLPTRRLWGAGPATLQRMSALGLATIGDLAQLEEAQLVAAFGASTGQHFHALSRGIDPRPVMPDREARSISRETTFEVDLVDDHACRRVLLELAEDVGQRLRQQGLVAGTVRLKLRHPPFETTLRQARVQPPTDDDLTIHRLACELFRTARPPGRPVRLLGVGAASLGPARADRQGLLFKSGPLFNSGTHADRGAVADPAVNATLDAIRRRYGNHAARHAAAAPEPSAGDDEQLADPE